MNEMNHADLHFAHIPVLLDETISSLDILPDGIYVDATAGGGGHSKKILDRLSEHGRLIAIDRDPDAIRVLRERIGCDSRVTIVHDNYCNITSILKELGIPCVSGILADLGVSSYQLDNAERGFSFHTDAPLDMRMSKEGPTAADLCNHLSEKDLARIIRNYGEDKYASNIARGIVKARSFTKIETTLQLAEIIASSVPAKARRNGHPARKTFQALRIEVNGELEKLSDSLHAMFECLCPNGRLSIITFHSLEDKTVKHVFAGLCEGCTCPSDFPVCVCGKTPKGELPFRYKAPSDNEIEINPRSRSAKLRSIKKLK